MEGIRRSREFYRYLQPDNLVNPSLRRRNSSFHYDHDHVPSLSSALAPYCQLTALRCNAAKAMLNAMDRDVMYFLAEARMEIKNVEGQETPEFVEDPIMMSCTAVPLKGRICEMTIKMERVEGAQNEPAFIVHDLSKSAWADLKVVAGPPYYRFYAGVPIITHDGVTIGSLAIMDTKPRPEGLTPTELDFLLQTAETIMTYLETNRQAIEGRQSRRMAKGLESFIAGQKSIVSEDVPNSAQTARRKARAVKWNTPDLEDQNMARVQQQQHPPPDGEKLHLRTNSIFSVDSDVDASEVSTETDEQRLQSEVDGESRTHAKTFARAANLLRECMGDLGKDGTVSFVSLKTRFAAQVDRPRSSRTNTSENLPKVHQIGKSTDGLSLRSASVNSTAALIAFSTENTPFSSLETGVIQDSGLDETILRNIMKRYPSGHMWSLEDNPSSSSEDDQRHLHRGQHRHKSKRRKAELDAIRKAFPGARQVLFAPLWDASIGAFAHGVFVSATLETRSFNTTLELSFLNSFCSTIMAECSRLETMMADKQKSDFVGTISHEMRSPLHGVLASVEFLAETDVNGFQKSLIDTIDSCGRTLLDTINHVLDFSKVNSFQKQWTASNKRSHGNRRNHYLNPDNTSKAMTHGAPPLLQLFAITDISSVCEEVVEGLVLGNTFQSGIDIMDTSRDTRSRGGKSSRNVHDSVEILLDIEQADWSFMTQPGAVRRIIMNITGNAIKYTARGTILVQLCLKESADAGEHSEVMVFTVKDTGKGISPEFLSSRLFVPFAQENALAPGTGLGLSIVRSIVLMLGGTIDVQSFVDKGTTVEVSLPVKRPLPGQFSSQTTPHTGDTVGSGGWSTDDSIAALQNEATDVRVVFYHSHSRPSDRVEKILQQYVENWYHLEYVDQQLVESSHVAIVEEDDLDQLMEKAIGTPGRRPALVVLCSVASRHSARYIKGLEDRINSPVEFVAKPAGPYKLARSIRSALEKTRIIKSRAAGVTSLRTMQEQESRQSSQAGSGTILSTATLQEMDLGTPSHLGVKQLVHANETLVASQTSQHAQMALNDPAPGLVTPRPQLGEADAFPFPTQPDNDSKFRREVKRESSYKDESQRTVLRSRDNVQTNGHPHQLEAIGISTVNPHVLLVDDNKINLKLLDTYLRSKRRYTRIRKAEDGAQAVRLATGTGEPFDIIFMDVSMPVMNGFEATRAIRDHEESHDVKPGAMIIALTGLASGRDQSEGFDSGCDIYMTKPVSFKEVGKLLDNWEKHQQLGLDDSQTSTADLHADFKNTNHRAHAAGDENTDN